MGLLQNALQNDLPRRVSLRGLVGVICTFVFFILCAVLVLVFRVLLLVGIFVVDAIIKILVIEFLICAIKLSYANPKSKHDILVLHERSANIHQSILLIDVGLARVEGTEDDATS